MEEDRPDYPEAIQVGKRRSSLGALSKSKPVTKLKSMFEAKGPAPKIKDNGLLGKLKPVSVSHDGSSFAAAVSMGAPLPKTPPAPPELPPATPPEPLFSVMVPQVEQDNLPNLSPPRSVDGMLTSVPGYNESVHDGSEADARSAKSPSSAGFLKRMSSSLKKALTPKSSAGKHKPGASSPGYAGSETSNISPRPSAQLLMTPSSQPSSTSLDLSSRCDQLQGAAPLSPSASLGYEARDDPEWSIPRSHDAVADNLARSMPSSARPPKSPTMTPGASGPQVDCIPAQHVPSPRSASRDVAPRQTATGSPDQMPAPKASLSPGGPAVPEDSFVSADSHGAVNAAAIAGNATEGEDSFAASLTASPTMPEGSEASRGSPPMREVNMGAALFSPPPSFPSPSEHVSDSNGDGVMDGQGDELVFPSLASSDLAGSAAQPVEAAPSATAAYAASAETAPAPAGPVDVDMDAADVPVPVTEEVSTSAVVVASAEPVSSASCMEVDGRTTQPETALQPPLPLASRRSFGAALNLDLSATASGIAGLPSPDATTPTGEGDNADSCIIGLTPVRPETAAMSVMNVDTPALSTVAEGSPEASSPPVPIQELRAIDFEGDGGHAHAMHAMDVDLLAVCAAGDELVQSAAGAEQSPCGRGSNTSPVPADVAPFQQGSTTPSSPHQDALDLGTGIEVAAPAAGDMDWDGNDAAAAHEVAVCEEERQQAEIDISSQEGGADGAGCVANDGNMHAVASPRQPGLQAEAAAYVAKTVETLPVNALPVTISMQPADFDPALPFAVGPLESDVDQELAGCSVDGQLNGLAEAMPDGAPENRPNAAADEEQAAQGRDAATLDNYNVPDRDSSAGVEESEDSLHAESFEEEVVPPAATSAPTETQVQEVAFAAAEATDRAASGSTPINVADEPVMEPAGEAPSDGAAALASVQLDVETAPQSVKDAPYEAPCNAAALEPWQPETMASSETSTDGQLSSSTPASVMCEASGQPEVDANMDDAEGCTTQPPSIEAEASCAAALQLQADLPSPPSKTPAATPLSEDGAPFGGVDDGAAHAGNLEDPATVQNGEFPTPAGDAVAAEVVEEAGSAAAELELAQPEVVVQESQVAASAEDLPAPASSEGTAAPQYEGADAVDPAAWSIGGQAVQLGSEQSVEPALPSAFLSASAAAAAAFDDGIQSDVSAAVRQQAEEQSTDLMDVDSAAGAAQLREESAKSTDESCAKAVHVAGGAPKPEFTVAVAGNAAQDVPSQQEDVQQPEQHVPVPPVSPAGGDVPGVVVALPAGALLSVPRYQQQSADYQLPMADYDLVAFQSAASDLSLMDAAVSFAAESKPTEPPSVVADMQQAPMESETATAPPHAQPDDPMMVSPMPLRMHVVPPLCLAREPSFPQASPDGGALNAPPSATQSAGTPGMPTPISPETARLGVRAFQLDDIEEPDAGAESQVTAAAPTIAQESAVQEDAEAGAAAVSGLDPPMQSSSSMVYTAAHVSALPATVLEVTEVSVLATAMSQTPTDARAAAAPGPTTATADQPVPDSTALDRNVADSSSDMAALPDVIASLPSVSTPPALAINADVPMADSLETIEALWGNDDLLAEDGNDAGGLVPLPQICASSPVSASKQSESPVLHSSRKVAPGVVLQVQRESLDLFSLRNSCTARVSDSLMVESLDSFESIGLCAKSRAVGFVPMAPLKEANEHDEDTAAANRSNGSEGGSAPSSAGAQSPVVTFAAGTGESPESLPTPVFTAATTGTTGDGTPCASKPAACSAGGRSGLTTPVAAASGQPRAPAPALKAASPSGNTRAHATPSTALKAMAAASAAGPSAAKAGVPKRPLPSAAPPTKALATPGQAVAGTVAAPSGSRLPGFSATPSAGVTRGLAALTPAGRPPMHSQAMVATPGAAPGRPGVTPRSGGVFTPGNNQPSASAGGPGQCARHPVPVPRQSASLFDTPVILRAAAVPLADTPFSVSDFDLDAVDISAEASKAIAALGAAKAGSNGASVATGAASQQATPGLATTRVGVIAGTPTISVLETHVQLLTNKLAQAEADIHQLQDDNAMLRDQVSTMQFQSSMTNDSDMERAARQFLEEELAVVRHRSDGLEAELRAAHQELKRREQAAAELVASQQTKEAEWARMEAELQLRVQQAEAELQLRVQQMTSELETARSFAQQADARINEAEARAVAATAKCDEETARSRDLQVTLGLQAHQLVQVQRARDDAEAKFQRAMEQLIAAQTSHKKAVVEYEQKIQHANSITAQFNEARDRYRQMKQHAAESEQRATQAEAKAQETANALSRALAEKNELLQMCNELLTQLEVSKAKGGR